MAVVSSIRMALTWVTQAPSLMVVVTEAVSSIAAIGKKSFDASEAATTSNLSGERLSWSTD